MSTENAKQIVYYFDGDKATPDVVPDPLGELQAPAKGSVVERRGKLWEVVHVNEEHFDDGQLPIYRVYLRTPAGLIIPRGLGAD